MKNLFVSISSAIAYAMLAMCGLNAWAASPLQVQPSDGSQAFIASVANPFPTLSASAMNHTSHASVKSIDNQQPPIMKISPSGATILGWHAFPEPTFWGELNTSGEQDMLWTNSSLTPSAGFVKGDKFYSYYAVNSSGYLYMRYYINDLATGATLEYGNLSSADATQFVFMCAYDEKNDKVYAYTYNADGSGKMLQTIDPETRTFTKLCDITSATTPQVFGYNSTDNKLYGVSRTGDFVRISTVDGSFEKIASTGITPSNYKQAMTYSPIDKRFVWAALRSDFTACIVSIDAETGKAEVTAELPQFTEYTILTTSDKIPAPNTPERPVIKSFNFPNASNSGSVTVVAPSTHYDGSALSGKMTLKSLLDGTLHSSTEVNAGEEVEIPFSNVSDGTHTFSFSVIVDETSSSATIYNTTFIGKDTPKTPANVVIDSKGIKWDAVTEGINAGYIETSKITYNVYLNGTKLNEAPVTATEYAYELPYGKIKAFVATVEAVFDGRTSERGTSPRFLYGEPYTVPVDFTFTPEEIELCIVENSNGDNNTWKYDSSRKALLYHYGAKAADDWLFVPVTKFTNTTALYEVSVNAWVRSRNYTEAFEIAYGKEASAAAMTVLASFDNVVNEAAEPYTAYFSIPEAGDYYVGVHCVSKAMQDELLFNKVSIKESQLSTDCPEVPAEITATAADKGELSAIIGFTMPTKTISGKTIAEGTSLTAVITSAEESVTVNGTPGQVFTGMTLKTVQGSNEITLQVANGELKSKVATVSVYTGISTPGSVSSLKAAVSDDNMSAHITWNAPTWATSTEGYYDKESLRYYYCDYNFNINQWVEKKELGANTNFDFSLADGTAMGVQYVGIKAENKGGKSPYVSYLTLTLGTPFKLPIAENFAGGKYNYTPIITVAPNTYYSGKCKIAKPEDYGATNSDADNYALVTYPSNSYGTSYSLVALPKFSTVGAKAPRLTFSVFGGPTAAYTEIHLVTNGVEETKVASFYNDMTAEWHDITIDVPEAFKNKKWVEARIFTTYYPGDAAYTIIDSYKIFDAESENVEGIAATQAVSVTGGDGIITVKNAALSRVSIFSVDGKLVREAEVETENSIFGVDAGIYVVRVGSTATKVVVR